jgi:hypothetical protein
MSDNTFSSEFNGDFSFTPTRNLTSLVDDECYQQRQNMQDSSKMKYVTTNYIDLLEGHSQNWFGISMRDQLFTPAENMDADSNLRNSKLTNCKVRNNFGQLPIPTLPALYNAHAQDTDKESKYIWPLSNEKHGGCQPMDTNYHDRSWYIFPEMKHQAIKSVQKSNDYRQGTSTRFVDLDKTQEVARRQYAKTSTLLD